MEGASFTRKVPQMRTFHLEALWSFVLRMFARLWKGIQFQELVFVIVILLLLRSEKIIVATSYPGENENTISKAHYRFVRDYVDRLELGVDSHWTSEASLVVWLNAIATIHLCMKAMLVAKHGTRSDFTEWLSTQEEMVSSVPCQKVAGSGGPGRDEVFGFCRFSRSGKNPVLYITAMRGQGGSIVKWDSSSWKRVSTKHVVRDPVCVFNASADGMLLAVALVSVLLDSSARVTMIKDAKRNGLSLWIIVLVILLATAAYYVKTKGILH